MQSSVVELDSHRQPTIPRTVDDAVTDERLPAQVFRYLVWLSRFDRFVPTLEHQARFWRVSPRTLRRWRAQLRSCGYSLSPDSQRPVNGQSASGPSQGFQPVQGSSQSGPPMNGHSATGQSVSGHRSLGVRRKPPWPPPPPSPSPPVLEAPEGGVNYNSPLSPSAAASLTPRRAAAAAAQQARKPDTEGNDVPKPEPIRLDLFQFLDIAEEQGFGNLKLLHGEFISSANREALMVLLRARPEHLRQAFDALLQLPVEKRPRTARFWLRVLTERVGAMDAPSLSAPDKPVGVTVAPEVSQRLNELREILDELDDQERRKQLSQAEADRRREPFLQEFDELLQA